jgi:hypothetical protein
LSQKSKDSARQSTRRIVLKVAIDDDGTYEIILNGKVVGRRIPESWLDDELCADSAETSLSKSNNIAN